MNLNPFINEYIRDWAPGARQELDWYRQQPNLNAAIGKAGQAMVHGKRHSHQWRLRQITLDKATAVLLQNKTRIHRARDFDELHSLIDRIVSPIQGIGELYVYDTSLRIGAKLGLSPEKVYLHRGTRWGAKVLGLGGKEALEVPELPKQLQRLAPYEVEDFLCIYRPRFLGDGFKGFCRRVKRPICAQFRGPGCREQRD